MSLGKYYLYRHVRLDKNQPFYIGIGTKTKKDLRNGGYQRAGKRFDRNPYWCNIVNKSEYMIEILMESDDYNFIKMKEIEFIKLYGRKDLGTGILANMTDGGEGTRNKVYSAEYRRKISEGNKGKVRSAETLQQMSKAQKGIKRPYSGANATRIKVQQLTIQGELIKVHNSLREACDFLGVKHDKYISKVCKGEKSSYKGFKWKIFI